MGADLVQFYHAEMYRGTYSFLGNGRVFKAHFQVVALQAVSNVQAWERAGQHGTGTGGAWHRGESSVASQSKRCCRSEHAKDVVRSTTTVIRFGWELQMTGSGHRIGQRRSKASLPSLGTLSAASLCSARCLPWRRVCANSTRPNLAGPLRQGPSVAAWGLSLPNASFSLGLARLTLQKDQRHGSGSRW